MKTIQVTPEAVEAKNLECYDAADDLAWRLAVYEPVHDGWELANLGGRPVLDRAMSHRLRTGPGPLRVLEPCCGTGDSCRYLASHHDVMVTGVEWNRRQFERACSRRAAHPDLARRLDFRHADFLSWRPESAYDLVVAVDSLNAIPDLPSALQAARRATAPGGVLVVADLTAGPRLGPEHRKRAWDGDGILNLPTPSEYAALLDAAGFDPLSCEDWTEVARRSLATIGEALGRRSAEIRAGVGDEQFACWSDMATTYERWMSEEIASYTLLAARARSEPDREERR